MNGYTLTKVWNINGRLVIGKTIEDALKVWRTYMRKNEDPKSIINICTNYDALMEEYPAYHELNDKEALVLNTLQMLVRDSDESDELKDLCNQFLSNYYLKLIFEDSK